MAQKVIFEKKTIDGFALDSNFGVHSRIFDQFDGIEPFTLVVGETYEVTWGDNTHTCVAQDASAVLPGVIGLGNCAIVGLSGNNEPFAIAWSESGVTFLVMDGSTDTSHTIGIYQETETPAITLKDRNGKDVQHEGVTAVNLLLEDGTEQIFIPGEAQEKTVAADFSKGDMVVTPDAGKLLTEVTIPKPETLTPENIVKDVEVAGITGTAEMPESVETTVELDFSAGDMEVTPEAGTLFNKVAIPTPANLIPANIAEGVDIAGIIGTLAAGGSGGVGDFNIFTTIWTAPAASDSIQTATIATVDELAAAGIATYAATEAVDNHLWTAVFMAKMIDIGGYTKLLCFSYKQNTPLMRTSTTAYSGIYFAISSSASIARSQITVSSPACGLGTTRNYSPALSSELGLAIEYWSSQNYFPQGQYLCAVIQHTTKTTAQMTF